MSETIIRDNYFLLYSLIMGVSVTVFYDLLRIFRRVVKHGNVMISLEDLLYWVIVAVSVFYMMHEENNGTLRWFAILGAMLGMFLYKKLFSNLFVSAVSSALSFLLKYLGKILHILLTPIRFLLKKCRKGMKALKRKSKRGAMHLKKKLTKLGKTLKMVVCKQ